MKKVSFVLLLTLLLSLTFINLKQRSVRAQSSGPEMLVPDLDVRTSITDLITPISMAFLGANDFFVLEKNTGKVQRVVNGAVQSTVLDLGVNFA
jgi:glucose/arabinose dehydrogenase